MTMIFNFGNPVMAYVTDGNGNVIKAVVKGCTLSTSVYAESEMHIECADPKVITRQELGNIDPHAFECLLEGNYGRDPEVQEEVHEETAEEG